MVLKPQKEILWALYRVILSVLDPRKCERLKDYSLDFEHAYMTTYLASWRACWYLFAALWHPDVIRTTTGAWRHVARSCVIVLCGSEGEWCTQQRSVYSSFVITGWQLRNGCFQQDGATCHTSNESMTEIESFFDDRIISKPLWPPRSPDLRPPDFFL